jgi:hypothetical protein
MIAASEAVDAALAIGHRQANPLTTVGFVYLGRWRPPAQTLGHGSMPDPIPAYAIQLLANPGTDPDDEWTALIIVHAETGEPVIVLDNCTGSTCVR